jgi:hypothetical protein
LARLLRECCPQKADNWSKVEDRNALHADRQHRDNFGNQGLQAVPKTVQRQ